MGNPFCPYCRDVLLVTKTSTSVIEKGGVEKLFGFIFGKASDRIGMSKYWWCRKCKRHWKKGGAVIMRDY